MTDEYKSIGKRIRDTREEQNLSREKFAEKANISSQFLADIETGKKGMTIDTLIKICNAFGVSANAIIYDNNDKDEEQLNEIMHMLKKVDTKTIITIKSIIKLIVQMNNQ
ncbi:MAG: helix-turn-helix domain-containing protein [Clostridia bacterium]|nr:helix-turn-helix domain-containing protein [Clostridia bacterium]